MWTSWKRQNRLLEKTSSCLEGDHLSGDSGKRINLSSFLSQQVPEVLVRVVG